MSSPPPAQSEEFDHVLYLQHAGFDSRVHAYQNATVADESTALIRSKYTAKHFCDIERSNGLVDAGLLVHRKMIRGMHPNSDTEVATLGDPATPPSIPARCCSMHHGRSSLPW